MRVVAIVLAAGFSRRLGRSKQDVLFEGETLLARATRIAREVADDVVVVTRENNPDAEEGMASSIRVASSFDANPPNTTECMAPSRAHASIANTASAIIVM